MVTQTDSLVHFGRGHGSACGRSRRSQFDRDAVTCPRCLKAMRSAALDRVARATAEAVQAEQRLLELSA
jgi:hypothetical protein